MYTMMDPKNLPKFVFLHSNHKYRLKLGFYAAPSNPKTFSKAVKDELNKLKFTYCTELNGLVMGFGKISSNELIPADIRHCISVAVNVDVFIFRPPVGSVIEAVVNQTSENHISCLVHNLFNVSIVRPEHQPYSEWPGSKIKKDDEICVKVLSFDLAKKLPHITGEIVVNKNYDCYNSKDEQKSDTDSISFFDESVSNSVIYIKEQDSISSSKQSCSDSESSIEMNSKSYVDKPTKLSAQSIHTTINHNGKLIKSPLSSSTPVSNSEHSVGSINLIRTKQLKQLHKHLAKNIVNKQKSMDLDKSNDNTVKKDNLSSSSDIFASNNLNDNKCKLPSGSINNTDYSSDVITINSPCSPCDLQSDSDVSNDERRHIKSFQNCVLSTSKTSPKSIKKLNSEKNINTFINSLSPNKVKSEGKPTNPSIFFGSNIDNSNDKYEGNSVYTQLHITTNPDSKNSICTQSVHNSVSLDNFDKDSNNKCKSPNKLRLSTGSIKPKNSPKKIELKISENENKNDFVELQSNSMFSMISDVDSSSNEELFVPHINHEVEFVKETENSTINTLPASKRSVTIDQYTSSSDDEVYTKLKQNISKMESAKPCAKKIKNQNLYGVCSSDSESDLSSIHDTTYLKNIKSNSSPIKSVKILVSDKHNLSNDNLLPYKKSKDKRKQSNETSVLIQSSKCSNDKNKLLSNLNKNENNANEIRKQILKNSSCSDLINQKGSNIKLSSSTSKSERIIKPKIKKNSNPFRKLCSTHSTSSSSDEVFINNLRINHSSKKKSIPLRTKDDKKNTLIHQLLTSVECDNQKNEQKLTTQGINSSSSEEDKFAIVEKFNKNIPMKKCKKDALKCFKNSIEEPSLSSVNVSQKSYPLELQIKSSTDDSTDDEIDFIKKIVENKKLTNNNKLKSTLKKNNPENVTKYVKHIEKLDKKLSSAKTSKLINKTTKSKTKQLEEPINLLLDTIDDIKELSSVAQYLNKQSETFEKEHKKPKSQNLSLDKTNKLSNIIKTKNVIPKKSKDEILGRVLNSFDDSFSSVENSNSIQSNVLSEPSEKKIKKSTPQCTSTVTSNVKSTNDTIKIKSKKSIDEKDLLVESIMNFLEDFPSNKRNNPTQLNKISKKKNKKSKPIKSPITEKHEVINNDMKTKQNNLKKNKNLLLDHKTSSTEDSASIIKNKTSKFPITSTILTDQLSSDTLKTKHKVCKGSLLDSITSSIDNSTQLNKSSKICGKKNKKSKLQKSSVTDGLVSNTLKIKEEKPKESKDLLLDRLIKSITDSSSTITHSKKRSKESEDCLINSIVDFLDNDIPSKKKKKDNYLRTDKTNKTELKIEDSVSLSKICKKKKTKLDKSDINTMKDYKHKYTLTDELEKTEKNTFIDKKKKKKRKMLPNNPIQHTTYSNNTEKIIKTNNESVDKNPKKSGLIKKKSKKLSKDELKDFMSSQNDHFMKDINNLYHSLNTNLN